MTLDIALPPMRGLGRVRVSRRPMDGHPAYGTLLADALTTNACPVWISERGMDRIDPPGDPQEDIARIGTVDPSAWLTRNWAESCPFCGCRDALPDGPTELISLAGPDDEPIAAASRHGQARGYLALAPVTRSADVIAALGWTGAANRCIDLATLSAVLRSWEVRFGATVVCLDAAVLWLSVAAPPRTPRECVTVAAEHFTFCPDVDGENPRPLHKYAAELVNSGSWRFWWD